MRKSHWKYRWPHRSISPYAATDALRSRQGEYGVAFLRCLTRCGSQVAIDLAFAAASPLDLHLPRRHSLFIVSSPLDVGVHTQACACSARATII
eukprot:1231955-Pleurochrysis_carterae.AAC.2